MTDDDQPLIAVTRRLPAACEARLEKEFCVRWGADSLSYKGGDIAALCEGAAGLIVTPAERLDAGAIAALPASLKAISCFSVGYEHVALEAAKARGILVTNTPGVLTEATADIALLLLLGAARRASEGERMVRAGHWTGWRPTQLVGQDLCGKTLGLFGMGRIGQAVARRALGFGLKIIYHNRQPVDGLDFPAEFVESGSDFLSRSAFLSLHAPLTPETQGFLNSSAIELLPHGAIVINTARGPLVDDDALISALTKGRVAAAGLDVYSGEPDLDQRYLGLENVFLLPHLGSATTGTREAMGMLAIDNLKAALSGSEPPHRVV